MKKVVLRKIAEWKKRRAVKRMSMRRKRTITYSGEFLVSRVAM